MWGGGLPKVILQFVLCTTPKGGTPSLLYRQNFIDYVVRTPAPFDTNISPKKIWAENGHMEQEKAKFMNWKRNPQ